MKSYSRLNTPSATNVTNAYAAAASHGPEAEFILRCLRAQEMDADDAQLARLLECHLDWNALLALARRHAVLPRLHQKLVSMNWEGVPSRPRIELETFFRHNAARNLATVAELIEIIKICRNNSIPVIPFKGVVLAHRLYGNFALRVSNDLDLLVREQDSTRIRELLALRGYESSWALRPCYEQALLQSTRQIPLVNKRGPWAVEIHTALLDGPSAQATSFDSLNLQLETTTICGQSVDMLAIDQLLLYLCAHGAKHCWERLGWICDVAQLIRRCPNLDWPVLLARARELRWERALLVGLALARDLIGVTLPATVEHQQLVVNALTNDAASRLFRVRRENGDTFWQLWFQLRCRECQRDRVRFAWATVMRPTVAEWQWLSLPAQLSFLYYLLRPIRLIGKYAGRLTRTRPFQTNAEMSLPITVPVELTE